MAKHQFQEQIDNACSAQGWDQGNETSAPNNQAMSGGVSSVQEKCNAATNVSEEGY